MSSSPTLSFSLPPGDTTHLRCLLAEKAIALANLTYCERQLTRQHSSLSTIPLSSHTTPLKRFYYIRTRISTLLQASSVTSLSMSSHSPTMSSLSSSVPPPPVGETPPSLLPSPQSPSSVSLPQPDSRTLRRLRREHRHHSNNLLSQSFPPPRSSSPSPSRLLPTIPPVDYPSPPLTPSHQLPAIVPSSLVIPPSSSSVTMAHSSSSSHSSPFSFAAPHPSSSTDHSHLSSAPPPHHTSSTSPPPSTTPIASTPAYPMFPTPSNLPPLNQSQQSLSPPPPHDILQPDPTHITTDEIQRETHTSGILRTEFTNFPRIPDHQLNERLVTSLLERLAQQLSIDSAHTSNCREAQCIRNLRTSFHWRRLALWLRTYTDKSIHLSYPRTEYWTRLYDTNVHYCHHQQPEQLDLATALQRLTQNLTRQQRSPPLLPTPSRSPNSNPSPFFPSSSYSRFPFHSPPSMPSTFSRFSHSSSPPYSSFRPSFRPPPPNNRAPFRSPHLPSSSSFSPPPPSQYSNPFRSPSSPPPHRPMNFSPRPSQLSSSHYTNTPSSSQSSTFPPSRFPSSPSTHHHPRTFPRPYSNVHDTSLFDTAMELSSSSSSPAVDPSFTSTPHSPYLTPLHENDPLDWYSSPDAPSPYCYDSYYHDFLIPTDPYSYDHPLSPPLTHPPDYYSFDESNSPPYTTDDYSHITPPPFQ